MLLVLMSRMASAPCIPTQDATESIQRTLDRSLPQQYNELNVTGGS